MELSFLIGHLKKALLFVLPQEQRQACYQLAENHPEENHFVEDRLAEVLPENHLVLQTSFPYLAEHPAHH
jgi:hypothetical protein